jgi:multidrug resistance efflux pump
VVTAAKDEGLTDRQRYELALETLKQTARRLMLAKRRSEKHLAAYQAGVEQARRVLDGIRKETG